MKLVFLTQVLDRDDAVLGFVPRWVEGFARHCERVRVVALSVGDVSGLPANVDVREVGRSGVIGRYLRYRRFLREALRAEGFDAVLAHMVPRYALVAAGPTRAAGGRLYLWYTHGAVDQRLRRAVERADKVFTATVDSLRIETRKRVVTGHGVDLEHFAVGAAPADGPARVLSVGRLTPAKDPLVVIEALALLAARGRDVRLDLVGGTLAQGDPAYLERVRRRIEETGLGERVSLHGAIPYRDVPDFYRRASVVVNASSTGSLDKVVLEAMAARRIVLSCNDGFGDLVAELGASRELLGFRRGDAADLAARIERALALDAPSRDALTGSLRAIVARDHEVDRLMARLCSEMDAPR